MHPQGARRRRSRRALTPASPRASISYVQHADSAAWCMLPLWEIFACEVAAHFHMRASDHTSSQFTPSCRSARSSPRRPFRWKSVAPGRYASLEHACFSRRSGRPRWRVRKAAACTIHVVGRARRALPSPPPRCAGAWWTYPRRHVQVPHFSTEHARYFARIRRQLLGIWRLCLLWM